MKDLIRQRTTTTRKGVETRGPDHEHCWLLGAPCKHDGSSLYAVETMLPMYIACGEDLVYWTLESRYSEEFREEPA